MTCNKTLHKKCVYKKGMDWLVMEFINEQSGQHMWSIERIQYNS